MNGPKSLKPLLTRGETIVCPGVFDGLSARLVAPAGFKAIYASGGAIARSMGLPDLGLISSDAVLDRLRQICDATELPVIADADTGYGNALNVYRAARDFARAGVSAFHLEDQTSPKRCGHLDDKSLVPIAEMVQKIVAAKEALAGADVQVIARTDAIAVEGYDAAIARMQRYVEVGADIAFVEAPTTLEQIADIPKRLGCPTLINMFHGGKTPLVPIDRLQVMGYAMVIVPSDLQRAALHAMREALAALARDGSTAVLDTGMVSFYEREAIVGTADFLALGTRLAGSRHP